LLDGVFLLPTQPGPPLYSLLLLSHCVIIPSFFILINVNKHLHWHLHSGRLADAFIQGGSQRFTHVDPFIHTFTHSYTPSPNHTHIHTHVHPFIQRFRQSHIRRHIDACMHIHPCIHPYTHTFTRSHIDTFTHSCTHPHTGGGVDHARWQPARREHSGWGALLGDTSTLG
jgi:hypothetical protein